MRRNIGLSLLFVALLASCASAHEQTLYLLRHFDKQPGGNDPALTLLGQQRAAQLALVLADAGVQEIYSTDYNRTRETVMPLAQKLGLRIKFYDPDKLAELAATLANSTATVVIAGHSNTTPTLVRLLGGQAEDMDESQYASLFKLSRAGDKVVTEVSKISLADEEQ